jgi:hypothetical protein
MVWQAEDGRVLPLLRKGACMSAAEYALNHRVAFNAFLGIRSVRASSPPITPSKINRSRRVVVDGLPRLGTQQIPKRYVTLSSPTSHLCRLICLECHNPICTLTSALQSPCEGPQRAGRPILSEGEWLDGDRVTVEGKGHLMPEQITLAHLVRQPSTALLVQATETPSRHSLQSTR